MRILPVVLRFVREPTEKMLDRIFRASAITHGHLRSQMSCGFYGLVMRQLLEGWQPEAAVDIARTVFTDIYARTMELAQFDEVLGKDLSSKTEACIESSGYVIHTLTASLWCLLTTRSFEECVLKAVNLGEDSDTTGCVAGGLAGVHYGLHSIPEKWRHAMARHREVESLLNRFAEIVPTSKILLK